MPKNKPVEIVVAKKVTGLQFGTLTVPKTDIGLYALPGGILKSYSALVNDPLVIRHINKAA